MNQLPDVFYVIAIGTSSNKAMCAIAELNNEGDIRDKGYAFYPPKVSDYGQNRA
ncbi:MAG: hypothetical protein WC758_01575 [Candidatus Woesearchaeota archaeon]|jgi:hypothetical protein